MWESIGENQYSRVYTCDRGECCDFDIYLSKFNDVLSKLKLYVCAPLRAIWLCKYYLYFSSFLSFSFSLYLSLFTSFSACMCVCMLKKWNNLVIYHLYSLSHNFTRYKYGTERNLLWESLSCGLQYLYKKHCQSLSYKVLVAEACTWFLRTLKSRLCELSAMRRDESRNIRIRSPVRMRKITRDYEMRKFRGKSSGIFTTS